MTENEESFLIGCIFKINMKYEPNINDKFKKFLLT